MPATTPRLRTLARRLLTLEAAAEPTREATGSAAFAVCERLRQQLSTLAGVAGFRALLIRSLALAGDEVDWLKAVHVNADGSLGGLDRGQLSDAEIGDGEAAPPFARDDHSGKSRQERIALDLH